MSLRRAAAFAGAVLVLALAPPQADAAGSVPLRDDRGATLTLAAPPQRLVTLAPALTEAVCALGACDRLVGTDRYSNWPARVAALPKLGGLDDAALERIVALKPDLVLAARSTRAVARLESLGLRVLALEPKTFAETARMLDTVAAALGRPGDGAALWQRTEARVAAAAARVPAAWRGRRVYVEVASTPFAAGEASFVGELLGRLGLRNIVPAALGPFPQLNPEFIVRAQPELVIAGAGDWATMGRRPGWQALNALREGRGCGFAPPQIDLLMRAGPRLGEAAEAVVDCLATLEPAAR